MNSGKPPPPYEIMIAIPYWEGDKELARKMIDLMVDMEPVHAGRAAGVILVCRQDCKIDLKMVAKLKTRFDTRTYVSASPLRGWPQGPNGMFGSTMLHFHLTQILTKCVFWMEADCTPMYPGWYKDLAHAWACKNPRTLVMGWMGDCNGNGTGWHITGCALYDPSIAIKLPVVTTCCSVAWDYEKRSEIMAVGERTLLIDNQYRKSNPETRLMECQYAVVHGIKDSILVNMVREKMLTGSLK